MIKTKRRWCGILSLLVSAVFALSGSAFAQKDEPREQKLQDRKAVVYFFNRLTSTFCPTPDKRLLLAWPGLSLPDTTGGLSRDDHYALARLVNVVPNTDDLLYWTTTQQVPDLIEYVLANMRSPKNSEEPGNKARLKEAFDALRDPKTGIRTPMYRKYLEQQVRYDDTITDVENERFLTKSRAGDAKSKELQVRELAALTEFKRDGYYTEFTTIQKTIEDISNNDSGVWWYNFRQEFETHKSHSSAGGTFWDTEYLPPVENWLGYQGGWKTIKISNANVDMVSPNELIIAEDKVPDVPLLTFEGAKRMNIESFSISMEVKRVYIVRPWLDKNLFSNRVWTLDGVTPGPFGLTINKGTKPDMPYLISSVLIARNCRILLRGWRSLTEAAIALSSKSFGMVNLRETAIFGQAIKSGVKFEFKTGINDPRVPGKSVGVNITCPGVQIIGFLCDLVPKSPNPDPKYKFAP